MQSYNELYGTDGPIFVFYNHKLLKPWKSAFVSCHLKGESQEIFAQYKSEFVILVIVVTDFAVFFFVVEIFIPHSLNWVD